MSDLTIQIDSPELAAVEPSKAKAIRNTFIPLANRIEEYENAYAIESMEEMEQWIN